MARPTGTADLPLHHGYIPKWLSERMARLARVLAEAIVLQFGRRELLSRLAHPFWFQSMGILMGQDWHASGVTTSAVWAFKHGLEEAQWELGVHFCGGRGRHSRKTPDELRAIGERIGLDGERFADISRLVAKVDSAAVQDGFDIYLHTFVVSDDGDWAVVQQGMNRETALARRYHWLSDQVQSFVDDPHSAIEGEPQGQIINLADRRAAASRLAQIELVQGGPEPVVRELRRLATEPLPKLALPSHHEIRATDVSLRRLHANLAAAQERGPRDFTELLVTPGVGARTVFALALVAELLHGAPCQFTDPARFSFALGGKDGAPFPVPIKVYDETLRVLRQAVERAKLGNDDRLAALRGLDAEARRLERFVEGPGFDELVAKEIAESPLYDGRAMAPWPEPEIAEG